ncbi:hypothetical protein EDD29_1394 [Actinocorallia herbida]|uniref:Uncharacterized protein n=1 Tax=Actinocorallia herbida TaxID=58109 RepID=A0A3N1CRQ4_9ACTN|nr:hypothetical protein [Actinocorallia herbida]ROO83885.1 hypothetical protein EDD29_1394 [Actinocorallia herbida]
MSMQVAASRDPNFRGADAAALSQLIRQMERAADDIGTWLSAHPPPAGVAADGYRDARVVQQWVADQLGMLNRRRAAASAALDDPDIPVGTPPGTDSADSPGSGNGPGTDDDPVPSPDVPADTDAEGGTGSGTDDDDLDAGTGPDTDTDGTDANGGTGTGAGTGSGTGATPGLGNGTSDPDIPADAEGTGQDGTTPTHGQGTGGTSTGDDPSTGTPHDGSTGHGDQDHGSGTGHEGEGTGQGTGDSGTQGSGTNGTPGTGTEGSGTDGGPGSGTEGSGTDGTQGDGTQGSGTDGTQGDGTQGSGAEGDGAGGPASGEGSGGVSGGVVDAYAAVESLSAGDGVDAQVWANLETHAGDGDYTASFYDRLGAEGTAQLIEAADGDPAKLDAIAASLSTADVQLDLDAQWTADVRAEAASLGVGDDAADVLGATPMGGAAAAGGTNRLTGAGTGAPTE